MGQGSIFVLSTDDEIPSINTTGTFRRKYKHGALFKGSGVSVALVFRCIKESARADFSVVTNRCHWKTDSKLCPKLLASITKQHCQKRKRTLNIPLTITMTKMRKRSIDSIRPRENKKNTNKLNIN